MARMLLWLFTFIGFIMVIVDNVKGDTTDVYTKIIILTALSVLAICEAITEKGEN